MSRKAAPVEQRFWSKVDMSGGPDTCWPWLGFIDRDGYGKFNVTTDKSVPASRFAYEMTHGPIPKGILACHTCDNPSCCNPAHIYAGTHLDNNRDAINRGRRPARARLTTRAILTAEQVKIIRKIYPTGIMTQKELGNMFGVDHTTVSCIIRRKSWSHI